MYDALIIGSGGAALSCALSLKQRDLKIAIITKTAPTTSQTCQAQGGINAVLEDNTDTVINHENDTIKSGHGLCDDKTVSYMCSNASKTINWLDKLGVPFSRDDNNHIARRQMGGASDKRACYSADYTGLKILHTLYDNVLKEDIEIIDNTLFLNLINENNTIKGITAIDTNSSEVKQYLAKSVILATGGYGGIYHNYTTNSSATTADGIVSAYNSGAILENMEFVQFHPTALKDNFILISESARGEGGYLVTKDGKRFVDELLPRDVVAREIYKKIQNDEDVYLDLRHLGLEKILHLMPQEYKLTKQFTSLSMDKDLIPIIPASHYSMGGIKVDKEGKTSLNNLYAIGECSSNGVHGANRLGGNSLLEIIVFGKSLGDNLQVDNNCIEERDYEQYLVDKTQIDVLFSKEVSEDFYQYKKRVGELMYNNVGLFRDAHSLNLAKKELEDITSILCKMGIEDKSKNFNTNLKEFIEFKNMLECSKIVVDSALQRCESRGAHYRTDFPKEIESFAKPSEVSK
jgi:succinate dehydrogenase / fumarate reductase flavoprotein subunit